MFGTPLGIISNTAEYLMLDLDEEDLLLRRVDATDARAVEKFVQETVGLYRGVKPGVEVEARIDPEASAARFDPDQLKSVLTNLLDNAADAINEAMEDGGRVIIRARSDEGCIIVEVENNGPAIPDHVIDRVFEAF